MTTMSDIKLDRREFNHALRSAVGVYFTTRDMSGVDLNLPTWIPVESLTHRKDDGNLIRLEQVRFDLPLFDSGVSLRISMYMAYDKVWNVFYFLPRGESYRAGYDKGKADGFEEGRTMLFGALRKELQEETSIIRATLVNELSDKDDDSIDDADIWAQANDDNPPS